MARSRRSRPPRAPVARGTARPRDGRVQARRGAAGRGNGSRSGSRSGGRRRRPSSPTSGRRTPARRTTRSAFLAERGAACTRGRCGCSRRRRTGGSRRRLGDERVGLVTGEERVNEHAPILCCTVEMAPDAGEVLVLDEVQWADDEERGAAWTELLLAGEYEHIRLLGALDALPLVRRAFPGGRAARARAEAAARVRRRTPAARRSRPARSSSRSAGRPSWHSPVRSTGSSPTASRCSTARCRSRRAARRSTASSHGGADVCVATDVLGHGVNLPCETLLFAETTKFDGEQRRDLLPWELAQIAGRAGRFGLVERGHVGVLVGVPWANADPELVEDGLEPHVELPGGAPRLPHRRRGADRPAPGRPRSRGPARPRRRARRVAPRRDARVGARELARRRVAAADPRPARRRPAAPARARPAARRSRTRGAGQRAGRP